MAQESVEILFGRLLTDQAFREEARKNFQKAYLEIGLSLTKEERHLISMIDLDKFTALSDDIDGGLKRMNLERCLAELK